MVRKEFNAYVSEWAKKLGVAQKVKEIHLRPMKRKLASCSTRGRITFEPSILKKTKEEMDNIIVHELLHLKYHNHGKMFKILFYLFTGKQQPNKQFKPGQKEP